MNALLLYPQYPDTFWSFKHALRFIGKQASLPPMGLLTVASMMPSDWDLKLVDQNVDGVTDDDILWADLVFISGMTVQKKSAHRLIERCNRFERKVVAGGPLFTALHDEFPAVDHMVLDEAEITFPRFLADLAEGRAQRVYRTDEWADVTATPPPRWDLIDLKNYATMCVQYSRGCPFDCEFCDITVLYGHKPRTKSADQVLSELDAIYERGWKGAVFFVDDNFIGNKKGIKRTLLPAVIDWMERHNYPFSFLTQASINLAEDEELMDLMVRAGFDMVFIGIETPDPDSLRECGKVHNTRSDLLDNVRRLHAAGLQVQAGFIVGFDSDKQDIFQRISQFINDSGIVASMVGLLNAPPGTRLYNRLLEENRLTSGISGDNTDLSMNFQPKMDQSELLEGYKKIIREIYTPKAYYKRVRQFLRTFRYRCRTRVPFSRSHLRGLLMSIYDLGIKPGVRRYFWTTLLWTTLRRPRRIPLAITMSIYGAHFIRHFETVLE